MGRSIQRHNNPSAYYFCLGNYDRFEETEENFNGYGSLVIPSRCQYLVVIIQLSIKFTGELLPPELLNMCLSFSPSHRFVAPKLFDKFDNYDLNLDFNPRGAIKHVKKKNYMKKA